MFFGSIVAIVTPMKQDFSVDWQAFERLIEFQIENGTNAIVAVGTTGESATLEPSLHLKCIEFTLKVVNNRIPVIAGTGANNTEEAIHLANQTKSLGVDAHLSVAPYYNKPNQRGIFAHYKAITDACDLPLILYNVPSRTASDIEVDTVVELAKIPKIIGIKEASTLARCQKLLQSCPDDFLIFSGEDPINCQIISEGAAGAISVTANIAPQLMADVCRLAKTNKQQAFELDKKLALLHKNLFIEPNPSPAKWALSEMGIIQNHIRLPMVPITQESENIVRQAMIAAGITT